MHPRGRRTDRWRGARHAERSRARCCVRSARPATAQAGSSQLQARPHQACRAMATEAKQRQWEKPRQGQAQAQAGPGQARPGHADCCLEALPARRMSTGVSAARRSAPHVGGGVQDQMQERAGSTLRSSQAVPHPSTNRALCCLTSEVERDPVHSTRYGRRRNRVRYPEETIAFACQHRARRCVGRARRRPKPMPGQGRQPGAWPLA